MRGQRTARRIDARGPRAPGISTRPGAAASAQAWGMEERRNEEAGRRQIANLEDPASRCSSLGKALLRGDGGHAARRSRGYRKIRLRNRVVLVRCGDRKMAFVSAGGMLTRRVIRQRRRLHRRMRKRACKPIGTGNRLEQPRKEQHQHGKQNSTTNESTHSNGSIRSSGQTPCRTRSRALASSTSCPQTMSQS